MGNDERPQTSGFALVYVPFGLLVVAACLVAEQASQPTLRRAVYMLWLMIATATPPLVLAAIFDLRSATWPIYAWWRRLWSFAWVAYVLHLLFAHSFFEWNVRDIVQHQGWLVAGSNYLLAILWSIDCLIVGFGSRRGLRRVLIFHCAVGALLLVLVFTSAVLLHTGFVRVLGIVLTTAVSISVLSRIVLGPVPSAYPPGGQR